MANSKPTISLQRQVYIAVGSIVLLSVLLGAFVSGWWLLLAVAVSFGLLNAARTGTCMLTMLLSRLPFNNPTTGDISCPDECGRPA